MLCEPPPAETRDMEWIFLGQWVSYFTFPQVFGFLDYSCGKYFKKREFEVVCWDKQTGRWLPWAFAFGVFMPLCNFVSLRVVKTCDLLLTNTIWQGDWHVTPMITLHYIRLCLIADHSRAWFSFLVLKNQASMSPAAARKWTMPTSGVNLEARLSPFEPPDENPALADRLIIDPGWICPDSWPT